MRSFSKFCRILFFIGAIWLLSYQSSSACPSCYGNTKTPITHGMNMAIVSLLGVTGTVLGGFSTFFLYMIKKSNELLKNNPAVEEKGDIQ